MHNFCTYFDINYLPRALCLLDSLERYCASFKLYMLCMDDTSLAIVKALDNQKIIAFGLSEFETANPMLPVLKEARSQVEYYYTCGPVFIRYVMDFDPSIDIITYLDSDLYFFADPELLFEAFQGYSIGVMAHHLPEFRTRDVKQGVFNVGWISFRRDKDGMNCLELWRDQCIDWCFERFEDGKYADQLYLDQWPQQFKGFYEYTHHGANVAPWNVGDYRVSFQDQNIYMDDYILIFYHFAGLKKISKAKYNPNLGLTLKPLHPIVKQMYIEYIELLENYSKDLNPTASIRHHGGRLFRVKELVRYSLGVIFNHHITVKSKKTYANIKIEK